MQGPSSLLSVVTFPVGAGLGRRIVIDGPRGAIFEYNVSNALVGSWASSAGTDPYGHTYPEGFSLSGGVLSGPILLVYSGVPALGNLIFSVAGTAGTDSFGNVYQGGGATSYGAGSLFSELTGGTVALGSTAGGTFITSVGALQLLDALTTSTQPVTFVQSPQTGARIPGTLALYGGSNDGTKLAQARLANNLVTAPATGSMFEIAGQTSQQVLALIPDVSGSIAFSVILPGAARSTFQIFGSGLVKWGDGVNPTDTSMHRVGVGILQTDAQFNVGNILQVLAGGASVVGGITADTEHLSTGITTGSLLTITNTSSSSSAIEAIVAALAGDKALQLLVTGDTTPRLVIDSNGKAFWSTGAAAADTTLARVGVGVLETGGQFNVDSHLFVKAAGAQIVGAQTLIEDANNAAQSSSLLELQGASPQISFENAATTDTHFPAIGKLPTSAVTFIDSGTASGNTKHSSIWLQGSTATDATPNKVILWNGTDDVTDVICDGKFHLAHISAGVAVINNTLSLDVASNGFSFDHKILVTAGGESVVGGLTTDTFASNAINGHSNAANPTGTVSTTLVMMGLGTSWTFTPQSSGKVMVTATLLYEQDTGIGGLTMGMRFGTGTAPANGAAVSGTRWGTSADILVIPAAAGTAINNHYPITFSDVLTLVKGTTYWLDVALDTSVAADKANIFNPCLTWVEVQ